MTSIPVNVVAKCKEHVNKDHGIGTVDTRFLFHGSLL